MARGPLPEARPLDAELARQKQQLTAQLRVMSRLLLSSRLELDEPVSIRNIAPGCEWFDRLRAQGGLTADEDRLLHAEYAFLAAMLYDRDYYPGTNPCCRSITPRAPSRSCRMINQNFNTDRYNAVGRIGLSLGGHPESKAWIDHFVKQLDAAIGILSLSGRGCWEESHTYANHVMSTILPTLHKLRKDLGINLFKDERLKRMFDFFVKTVTPPDKNWGARITPACGDQARDLLPTSTAARPRVRRGRSGVCAPLDVDVPPTGGEEPRRSSPSRRN